MVFYPHSEFNYTYMNVYYVPCPSQISYSFVRPIEINTQIWSLVGRAVVVSVVSVNCSHWSVFTGSPDNTELIAVLLQYQPC